MAASGLGSASLSHPGKPPREATPQLSATKGCCAPSSFHPQPNPNLTLPQATADFCTYGLLRTTMAQLTHDDELDWLKTPLAINKLSLGWSTARLGSLQLQFEYLTTEWLDLKAQFG